MEKSANVIKLTKAVIDNLIAPTNKGQIFYRDKELKGFAVRITHKGVKSFIIEKRIDGNPIPKRITLGRYGVLTPEQARREAQKILGKIATGIDPITEKKERLANSVTLGEAFLDYLRSRELKPGTIKDYKRVMQEAFSDWQNKPLRNITTDIIAERHSELGQKSKARANNAMRVLRAIFNYASTQYRNAKKQSLFPENPVKQLTQTRSWFRVKRRKTYIKPYQLGAWFHTVIKLENEVARDYLLHLLFSGLRPTEGAQLEKSHVDLKAKSFTLPDTKNHEAHTLPISDFHCAILEHRIKTSQNKYVFPAQNDYIKDIRWQTEKITEETSIKFTPNDLRRTFITIAENLDLSGYTLKRLLNHKIDDSDVTAGYIVTDVERLRKPMQMISNFILSEVILHYISQILQTLYIIQPNVKLPIPFWK